MLVGHLSESPAGPAHDPVHESMGALPRIIGVIEPATTGEAVPLGGLDPEGPRGSDAAGHDHPVGVPRVLRLEDIGHSCLLRSD